MAAKNKTVVELSRKNQDHLKACCPGCGHLVINRGRTAVTSSDSPGRFFCDEATADRYARFIASL